MDEAQVSINGITVNGFFIKPPREVFVRTEDLIKAGVKRISKDSSLGLKSVTGTVLLDIKGYWLKYF